MKKCPSCEQEKSLDQFRNNRCKPDGKQSICAICNSQRNKEWYIKNKRYKKKKTTEYKQANVEWLRTYKKTLKCQNCSENHPRCLDFHHRNGFEKEINISSAVRSWSLERLKIEIAKCDVLCANCHRKETFADELITF